MPAQKPPFYYRLAIKLVKPLYGLFLRWRTWRGSQQRADVSINDELNMRFARHFAPPIATDAGKRCVWVHAVSLGETNTIAPVVRILLADGFAVVMTNTTQTGYAQVEKLFGGQVSHSFLPVDDAPQLSAFLRHYQPVCAVFVETELWANALYELAARGVPSVLINARLNEKSFAAYQKFARLSCSMMHNLSAIICQDVKSKNHFAALGADENKLYTAPSLKFAVRLPKSVTDEAQVLKSKWGLGTPLIMVAASTHEGEELAMLHAFKAILPSHPNALLILVPRHPERFDEVAELVAAQGFDVYRRSLGAPILSSTQVYVADSMGELLMWYALGDFAFVGGSLADVGGHNPIEACLLDAAVMMGRHTQKCQVVVDRLQSADAIALVADVDELVTVWQTWLNDPSAASKQAACAKQLALAAQDADCVQYELLKQYLP